MKYATRINDRITIGGVPDGREVIILSSIGFRTFIDLRDDDEVAAGLVKRRCHELNLSYIGIPIARDKIDFEDVLQFYLAAYEPGKAPIYAFSYRGRRPLAFLLLLETVIKDEPVSAVFHRARSRGFNLEEDRLLQEFLIDFRDRWRMKETVAMLKQLRPDLIPRWSTVARCGAR